MGERRHAAALLWLGHAPSISLAIGPQTSLLLTKNSKKKFISYFTLTLLPLYF